MNLRQLRYIAAVARNGLNISAAADSLFTAQPGVSKQIQLLEEELGVQIFERSGKQLTRITPAGQAIIDMAERVLQEAESIPQLAKEFSEPDTGTLTIATTHTQARFVLPPIIRDFVERYPRVALHMHQGSPIQIAELAASGAADFAIASEALEQFEDLVSMPCYLWNRAIVTPKGHPLCAQSLTLAKVTEYPIVTCDFDFDGGAKEGVTCKTPALEPNVVFTAMDADVIKTYVRIGLGIGIVAKMAYDPRTDTDLCSLDASHLFAPSTTMMAFRRGAFLRGYMYDFIELFASHLKRELVDAASRAHSQEELDRLFVDVQLPVH
ncbi:MAG: HTH-type transcriptional regulator CysB [Acidiferrobacterales bacterium]